MKITLHLLALAIFVLLASASRALLWPVSAHDNDDNDREKPTTHTVCFPGGPKRLHDGDGEPLPPCEFGTPLPAACDYAAHLGLCGSGVRGFNDFDAWLERCERQLAIDGCGGRCTTFEWSQEERMKWCVVE